MTSLAFDAILGTASAAAAAILAVAWIVSACARSISNQGLPSGDRRLVARYNLVYMTIAIATIGAILITVRFADHEDADVKQKVDESRSEDEGTQNGQGAAAPADNEAGMRRDARYGIDMLPIRLSDANRQQNGN